MVVSQLEGTKGVGDARHRRLVGLTLWSALGLIPLLSSDLLSDHSTVVLLSLLTVIHGVMGFWVSGGPILTFAGMYCLSTAAFVGYAGLWWSSRLTEPTPPYFITAVAIGYFSMVAMYWLFWRSTTGVDRYRRDPIPVRETDARAAFLSGATMIIVGAALAIISPRGIPTTALVFSGTALTAVAAQYFKVVRPATVSRAVPIAGAVLYVTVIFNGYGRLTIVGMLCALAFAWSFTQNRRVAKSTLLAGAPLAIAIADLIRRQAYFAEFGPAPRGKVAGVDSDVSPLFDSARLMALPDFPHGWGDSFTATATFFIPRDLWSGKPFGFGRELTRLLEPEMYSSGHTVAALVTGEWYYNFGYFGYFLMVPTIGLIVRWLDLRLASTIRSLSADFRQICVIAIFGLLMSGVPDLVWAGSFTSVSRALIRCAPAIAILTASMLLVRQSDTAKRTGLDQRMSDSRLL